MVHLLAHTQCLEWEPAQRPAFVRIAKLVSRSELIDNLAGSSGLLRRAGRARTPVSFVATMAAAAVDDVCDVDDNNCSVDNDNCDIDNDNNCDVDNDNNCDIDNDNNCDDNAEVIVVIPHADDP